MKLRPGINLYLRSKARMADLIARDMPDIIIRNEARQMLATGAGGSWKAIASWVWELIQETLERAWILLDGSEG